MRHRELDYKSPQLSNTEHSNANRLIDSAIWAATQLVSVANTI